MTNEIKEILDEMKEVAEYSTASNLVRELDSKDCNLLLDYIHNLQEENENLKDYLKIMEKGKDNNLYRFLDYKQRIDKAIEMFDNEKLNNYYSGMSYEFGIDDFKKDLLDILRGDE